MGFKETQQRITHSVRQLIDRAVTSVRRRNDRPGRGRTS